MGMLSSDGDGWTVGTSENDWAVGVTSRHVSGFSSVVNDLTERLCREVKSHKFNDWSKSVVGSTDTQSSKSYLRDRSINNSLVAELLPETVRDLVRTVVLGNLLT